LDLGDPVAFAKSVRQAIKSGGRLIVMDFEPGALWLHGGRPSEASQRRPRSRRFAAETRLRN
jgi:hypothetical protein